MCPAVYSTVDENNVVVFVRRFSHHWRHSATVVADLWWPLTLTCVWYRGLWSVANVVAAGSTSGAGWRWEEIGWNLFVLVNELDGGRTPARHLVNARCTHVDWGRRVDGIVLWSRLARCDSLPHTHMHLYTAQRVTAFQCGVQDTFKSILKTQGKDTFQKYSEETRYNSIRQTRLIYLI